MIGLPSVVVADLLVQRLGDALGHAAVHLARRRSIGLRMVPASSQATCRTWVTLPVSVSTSTTATCAPKGNVGIAALNVWCSVSSPASATAPRSAHVFATAGVPATWKDPGRGIELDVGDVGFQEPGRNGLGLFDEADRRLVDGGATLLQRSAAHGAETDRSQIGVAPDEREAIDVDAGLRAREHRPRRLVALTVRRCPGEDGAGAVGVDLDRGVLAEVADATRDLDVHAHADPELLDVAGSRRRACSARSAS